MMNKTTQILFHSVIHYLDLTINLRMVGRTHAENNTTQFEKINPKATNENWVSIQNDAPRKTMVLTKDGNKQLNNYVSSKIVV